MRNKIKTLLLLTAFLFSGFMPSAELAGQEYGDVAETIKMVVGEIKIIPTRLPNRVMISKPDIADIEEVTNTEMTLVAKSVGTSNLHFWDVFGEQSIEVKVVTEDMAEVKRRIDSLLLNLGLPDVYTQAEDEEGKVFLLGSVKRTKDKTDITRMLGAMNRQLNLRRVASMARKYERNMDIMEQGEETISDLIVGRDEMDEESKGRASEYIQKARSEAGLDVEAALPSSSSAPLRPELSEDDQALIESVMRL